MSLQCHNAYCSKINLPNRPMAFLNELAANASAQSVKIVIYSGNDDSLVSHRGSEGMANFVWFQH